MDPRLPRLRMTRVAVAAACIAVFAMLAALARSAPTLPDELMLELVRSWSGPRPSWALLLADIGYLPSITGALLLAVVVGVTSSASRGAVFGAAPALAAVSAAMLKTAFDRPRPGAPFRDDSSLMTGGLSFPSGHASVSAALGSVVVLAVLPLLGTGNPPRVRFAAGIALIAGCAWAVAVGVSRSAIGVHWPSDVLAGWCVGIVSALVAAAFTHRLRWRRPPPRR